ncbi:MFS transporter [Paenibacillus alvei]|uniref:MFS transporter n=1 Tax=Paenibacillus alvei TaxID=44250 RepID=A0ABT4H4L3_PAEAL|nr:MFS transporter [Paenibacillus alvei]MCY9763693.1 MFS transporter [Paenibacillus alvei]MCY9766457.1 MFS transporter [Paenibacillus alvei]
MELDPYKRNWTIGALLLSIFLSSLDQTIVSTALPSIVQKIGGLDSVSWVFTIYMLASTAIMPVVGKLSDMYGRKCFFISGLILFTAGSLLCGFAASMPQLIAFRGIQGLGAGFLMPITFTLIFTILPQGKACKFQALFMGVYALSSVVGPSLGAFITEQLNWHWNFFVNIPFGIASILIVSCSLVESRNEKSSRQVDYAGAVLLILTTVFLLLAFKLAGGEYSWASWQVVFMLASGGIALIFFIVIELRAVEGIIPLQLFCNRTIAGVSAASFIQGMIMYGAMLYIPFFIQAGLGGDIGDAGNALTPMMFSVMVGTVIGTMLMKRMSWRGSVLLAICLMGISSFLFSSLPLGVNMWYVRGTLL